MHQRCNMQVRSLHLNGDIATISIPGQACAFAVDRCVKEGGPGGSLCGEKGGLDHQHTLHLLRCLHNHTLHDRADVKTLWKAQHTFTDSSHVKLRGSERSAAQNCASK